jgi:hypothetical protein
LIAGNLKSLAFTTPLWSAKVCTTRIPAGLAAFRMSQISFLVIFLLAFGERKRVTTFRTCDLDVWHVTVSPERGLRRPLSLLFEAPAELIFRFDWLLIGKVGKKR